MKSFSFIRLILAAAVAAIPVQQASAARHSTAFATRRAPFSAAPAARLRVVNSAKPLALAPAGLLRTELHSVSDDIVPSLSAIHKAEISSEGGSIAASDVIDRLMRQPQPAVSTSFEMPTQQAPAPVALQQPSRTARAPRLKAAVLSMMLPVMPALASESLSDGAYGFGIFAYMLGAAAMFWIAGKLFSGRQAGPSYGGGPGAMNFQVKDTRMLPKDIAAFAPYIKEGRSLSENYYSLPEHLRQKYLDKTLSYEDMPPAAWLLDDEKVIFRDSKGRRFRQNKKGGWEPL